jgi:hypothetical protein
VAGERHVRGAGRGQDVLSRLGAVIKEHLFNPRMAADAEKSNMVRGGKEDNADAIIPLGPEDGEAGVKKIRIKKLMAMDESRAEEKKEPQKKTKRPQNGYGGPAALPRPEFDKEKLAIRLKRNGTLMYRDVKRAYLRYSKIKVADDYFVLAYANMKDAKEDYKSNLSTAKWSSRVEYMDNKYILSNLSYKETEESITERFRKFGEVERVAIERNRDGISTGKAVITFRDSAFIKGEVVMNSKLISVERIKRPQHNYNRLFLSHVNKDMTIVSIRKLVMSIGPRPTDIRLKYSENKRHNGYCFLTYDTEEKAKAVASRFDEVKERLGPEAYIEFSVEKPRYRKVKGGPRS